LIGRESHGFTDLAEESEAELLQAFADQHYLFGHTGGDGDLPEEILLPEPFPDQDTLGEVLSERRGKRVHLRVPARGELRRLTELAAANARHLLEDRFTPLGGGSRAESVLYELQDRLGIKVVPRLIVCFDISHTQGSELVAAVTAFENGEPKKAMYRRMRIRGEWRNDDFRSMAEAVERYLRRTLDDALPLPNLILIDGGRGQLSAVLPVVRDLGLSEIAIVALAKREEELFLPGRPEPLRLSRRDPALRLLQRIRNEAHRSAIGYNRKLRGRRTITSELGKIHGIGPARQRALLTQFGSVHGVQQASLDEIAAVPGFSRVLAERLRAHLGDGSPGS
jgi:excinuclease ABC subunit C